MTYVVDTNVVVSAAIRPASKPGTIVALMLRGQVDYVTSEELVGEYQAVLSRPKFHLDSERVTTFVEALEARSRKVIAIPQQEFVSPDSKDQFVIDLACTVDATIVTGNMRHYLAWPKVMAPAGALTEMLQDLRA